MSAAGFVDERTYDRRRHLTFGCLIVVVLVFVLALISSAFVLGCYMVSQRNDDILYHLPANLSDYEYKPGYPGADDGYDVTGVNVTTHQSVTSSVTKQLGGEVSYSQLSEVVNDLWLASYSRHLAAGTDYALHFQGRTNTTDRLDRAPKRLFQKMIGDVRRHSPIHRKFVRLINNYDAEEVDVVRRKKQEDEFLDEVLHSETIAILGRFLSNRGMSSAEFRSNLDELWFRSSGGGSSAFQTVFVGVKRQDTVFGLDNWIQFYLQEKAKRINYHGYLGKNQIGLLEVRFTWDGIMKPSSTMFIGTSPDFELALYSLCYFVRAPEICSFHVQGQDIHVEYRESTEVTEFIIDMSDTLT